MLCVELERLKSLMNRAVCRPILPELTRLVCGRCQRVETCPTLAMEQVVHLQSSAARPQGS
jgi:hypothetical protein